MYVHYSIFSENTVNNALIFYRLQVRIDRIEQGNYGDYKAVGSGVFEARITFGAVYRIYFIENGLEVVILLAGGNKSTQSKDIQTAVQIANEIRGTL